MRLVVASLGLRGRGGSSSGNGLNGGTSDYRSRGPEFDSRWELGFFPLLFFPSLNQWRVLSQVPRGKATLLIFQLSKIIMDSYQRSLMQSKLNKH